MGYEQNNGYYQNDGSHDQSWRDQTNVYQTQREQPTPMGRRSPCRKSGWFKGLLAVLLVVAISFGAFYLIRNVGVRLEKTKDGFTLSMTDRTRTPEQTLSAPEDKQEPLPEAAASNSDAPQSGAPASKPESGAYVGSGTKLNIDYFLDEVMDEDHIDDIYDYFAESDTDSLDAAIDELGSECSEDEIRLVRIKFTSELAN